MRTNPIFGFFFIVMLFSFIACRQNSPAESLFSYINTEEVEELELSFDQNAWREKSKTPSPAKLQWVDAQGKSQELAVTVKARGERRLEVCDLPPLKLKLQEDANLDGRRVAATSIKVVTHCLEDANGEDLLMRELLAYRMYNQLTDASYRVHLCRIRYVDASDVNEPIEAYALLLEPTKEVAKRLDAEKLAKTDTYQHLHGPTYARFVLFQYMIGNTDWNLSKRHNVRLFRNADGLVVPVPYDFDYAGLVDAPYAEPHPMLPIKDVKERFLQWRGKSAKPLNPICKEFRAAQEDLRKLCSGWAHLNSADKEEILEYLDQFFDEINNPTEMWVSLQPGVQSTPAS